MGKGKYLLQRDYDQPFIDIRPTSYQPNHPVKVRHMTCFTNDEFSCFICPMNSYCKPILPIVNCTYRGRGEGTWFTKPPMSSLHCSCNCMMLFRSKLFGLGLVVPLRLLSPMAHAFIFIMLWSAADVSGALTMNESFDWLPLATLPEGSLLEALLRPSKSRRLLEACGTCLLELDWEPCIDFPVFDCKESFSDVIFVRLLFTDPSGGQFFESRLAWICIPRHALFLVHKWRWNWNHEKNRILPKTSLNSSDISDKQIKWKSQTFTPTHWTHALMQEECSEASYVLYVLQGSRTDSARCRECWTIHPEFHSKNALKSPPSSHCMILRRVIWSNSRQDTV